MACREIEADDNLFRFAIYPTTYKGKAFAHEKFLELRVEDDDAIIGSLAWETYVPTQKLLHEYGCRVAAGINEKRRAEGKTKPKYRNLYCGAFQFTRGLIRRLVGSDGLGEILSADVVHKIENGEIAHAELRVTLRLGNELGVEGTKTAIVDRLWNCCHGPVRHVCECDLDFEGHPSEKLAEPPLGEYLDSRGFIMRIWYVIRFQVYRRLCRFSLGNEIE